MSEHTEEQPEDKPNKATIYFTVIFLVISIAFVGYVFFGYEPEPPKPESIEYNHFEFYHIGGLWETAIQLDTQVYDAIFRFNPDQVQDVAVKGTLGDFGQPVYITFDPVQNDTNAYKYLALASSELSLHIIRALEKEVIAACTNNETDACIERPIVTCDDTDKNVIYLKTDAPPRITLDGTCITLQGKDMDLLKSADRLLFQWYKIMR